MLLGREEVMQGRVVIIKIYGGDESNTETWRHGIEMAINSRLEQKW